MHEINGINISDINPDRICLNCRYWQVLVQIEGPAEGVVCRLTRKHTNPMDTCSQFMPNSSFDSLQDPNKYHEKSDKLRVFKRF